MDKAIKEARDAKIGKLKVDLSDAETEENFIQQRIQDALSDRNVWETELQQMKLDHCIKRQAFYNKWIQETEEAKFETADDVKSVVETMVADMEFVQMGKDYMISKEELKIRKREAFEEKCSKEHNYVYKKLGPPPTPSQGSVRSWQMP